MRELAVPIGVVLILSSMLLPLPAGVIDFLLVGNLVFALLLLGAALYLSDPVKLSSLPTILLLATLYRLALNISTTRLILSEGDAGSMIQTFGAAIMQDNIVVGVVVFLVITLVQFIVVAKGSERVAEVSARFTLDALPGKQMSIDADLRSGLLDRESARQKRKELQIESRFYGALDGAMKFVKGDAIAGLIVIAINITGGLVVGIVLLGFDVGTALNKYTLLTVGDGMLSQIPALLNALAAGMVVTRVVSEEDRSLAHEMATQLGDLRKARILAGGMAGLIGLTPGAPTLPFVLVGLVLLLTALPKPKKKDGESSQSSGAFQPLPPAVLQVSFEYPLSEGAVVGAGLESSMNTLLQKIYQEQGLVLAIPQFEMKSAESWKLEISVRGLLVFRSEKIESGNHFLELLESRLSSIISEQAPELVDDILTRRTLDYFDPLAPELVNAVVPNIISVTQLTLILKDLIRENVPIRNFDLILQAIAECKGAGDDHNLLLMKVRIALKRVICAPYLGLEQIPLVTCDPRLDLYLSQAAKGELALDPEVLQGLMEQLDKRPRNEGQSEPFTILASQPSRKFLADLLNDLSIPARVIGQEELVTGLPVVESLKLSLPAQKDDQLEDRSIFYQEAVA